MDRPGRDTGVWGVPVKIDLSTIGPKYAINVVETSTLLFQSTPISGGGSAVVEIRRSMGPEDMPSFSFPVAQTITLDGSGIKVIDVTDTPWVHVVVTTAEAGGSVDMTHSLRGGVEGVVEQMMVNLDATGPRGFVSTHEAYMALVTATPVGEAVGVGALEMRAGLAPGSQAVAYTPAETLTLDGQTVNDIVVNNAGVLYAICTTAQPGLSVVIDLYLRGPVHAET